MKKIFALLLITCLSTVALSQNKLTNYPESGFSAFFPNEPIIQKQSKETASGKLEITMYLYETDNYVIMISENKLPAELMAKITSPSGIEKLLEGSKNGALNSVAKQMGAELKIISEEKIVFKDKYPALKTIAKAGEYDIKALYIIKNNQLFQILNMGDNSNKDALEIFNSFEIN